MAVKPMELQPTPELMKFGHQLIAKYGNEAHQRLEPCWNLHKGFVGYGYFESCLAYCMVREMRPDVIFEISPACGFSTYPLALAVRENKKGRVYSFEINSEYVNLYKENMRILSLSNVTEIIQGDAKKAVFGVLDKVGGRIDILFMDSDHSAQMAEWYLANLLPKTRYWLQVHDIYYLWGQGEPLVIERFLRTHPEYKWLSNHHLAKQSSFRPRPETHGEANSSIWIKMLGW